MATKREILVRDLHIGSLVEELPRTVFPVKLGIQLARGDYRDTEWLGPPEYSFTIKRSAEMPYASSQTVWFFNPVECPDQGPEEIRFEEFAEQFKQAGRKIRNEDPKANERLYIGKLVLAEIPGEYVVTKDGRRGWHRDLYETNERVGIAKFDKRPKVHDEDVREDMGTSLPGRTLKPLKLTELKEVTLKPHGGSSASIGQTTKRKYYTDGQVEKDPAAKIGWSPSEWPDPTWNQMEQWFPGLANSEFLREFEFDGDHETDERFVERDVRIIDHDRKVAADGGGSRE